MNQRRKGITLVEMLVAAALTLFIMAILTEVFLVGLNAFRKLQALSDMDQQLRTTVNQLRRDLRANHFEGDKRLSLLTPTGGFYPPEHGFFSVGEGNVSVAEGRDAYNVWAYRDGDDWLHLTARLNGNKRGDYFTGRVPQGSPLDGIGLPEGRYDDSGGNTIYASQWAEVAYFLRPDPDPERTAGDDIGGPRSPLFNLFRRQLLLVPEQFTAPGGTSAVPQNPPGSGIHVLNDPNYWTNYDVSAFLVPQPPAPQPNSYQFNSPADIQFRERRFGGFSSAYLRLQDQSTARAGADLMLTNVISWDIKVWDPVAIEIRNPVTGAVIGHRGEFVDLGHGSIVSGNAVSANFPPPNQPTPPEFINAGGPFFTTGQNPALPRVYDTWSTRNNGPNAINPALSWNYADNNGPVIPPFWGAGTRPVPYPVGLKAIQIKLRVWDQRTKQTREVTIIQDL